VSPRTFIVGVVALALGVVATLLVIQRFTEPEAGLLAPPPPPAAAPLTGPPTLTPPEATDPAEARRLEELIEARNRYQSLRTGFTGPLADAPLQRLEPSLRALWPGRPPSYTVTCRGRVCRVEGPGEPATWRPQLLGSRAVAKVVDRVVVDPDGLERPAFLLVTEGSPGSGEDLLAGVERRLRESDEVTACLTGAGAGTVELEVQADQSGITYRAGGSAPPTVIDCVGNVLGSVAAATRVPSATQAATRAVIFQVGR